MSQLTDNKLTVVGGGGGGGPEKPNVTAGRILRVRRPQPQEDGSLVAAEIVEEVREDDAIIVDEALLQASSVRTERLLPPSHRNSEAPSIAVPMATTPTRETRDFNILDGGYGWMVVFGCFLMHVVNVGLIKSFGIIFVQLQSDYGAAGSRVAWIYSIFLVCSTWFAPLASVLANAFTQRSVVIVGGLFLGLGISFCYFANSLFFWYFSFGCLSGIGSALAYTPSVVCVGTYFEKRRALANGLSLSGAAVGSITVPYMMTHLIEEYMVSGAILISGAVAFNVCVAGALLRPIGLHSRILRAQERRAAHESDSRNLLNPGSSSTADSAAAIPDVRVKAFSAPASARSNGVASLYSAEESHAGPLLLETPAHDERKRSAHSMPDEALNSASTRGPEKPLKGAEDALAAGRGATRPGHWRARLRMRFRRKEGQPPLFDYTLFKVRLFITYAFAVMLSTVSYMIIFLVLPSHVVDLGQTRKDGAKFIAVIGVADIFARIGFGWFSDLKLFHRKWGFAGAIYSAAACNFCIQWVSGDVGLWIYAIGIGATSGSYISLVAVVCVDFFGLPRLSSALGSVIAFQSIAFLAGPPIITYLRDVNGSYIPGFMTLSLCLVCGASLIVLEHFLTLCLSRRNGSPPRKDPESNHDRVNHEMEALPTTTAAGATPSDDTVDILPVKPINFSPPFAHIDEFDTLTPRPVLKPVFKPKLRKHKGL